MVQKILEVLAEGAKDVIESVMQPQSDVPFKNGKPIRARIKQGVFFKQGTFLFLKPRQTDAANNNNRAGVDWHQWSSQCPVIKAVSVSRHTTLDKNHYANST